MTRFQRQEREMGTELVPFPFISIEAPAQVFEAFVRNFEAPGQTFEAPSQAFEAPSQTFEASGQNFEALRRKWPSREGPRRLFARESPSIHPREDFPVGADLKVKSSRLFHDLNTVPW